ncbi:preprotein translocase subunit SecE [Sporolactobacillus laevolacticus]|jgi:preprotein translocase subunit SecE|uniref:Protein translocase subunit SecE n=1 Tax=Sporolactobacillus laevolacticus DSM 442 TaxID=1395513 RepID=V6IUG3_9BACL|nr:preprotein translocase subunit SecE [Sporolactobacillus laevolacticus]EST10627.1 preprotein translocase subunit SecE [Sporolactobacillus laevolacticus DSM 442]MDF2910047.1 preprotein translocase subunit SecE [Sporolactobacillus laevolacticus]MDN3956789.1 preprotein translocase subunit SecE [Sporolactobacillus laevolacticus]
MASIIKGTGKFFQDIVAESKKITWPTRKEMLRYTVTVIVTVIFLALFFVVIDLGISQLLRVITNQ